MQGTITERKEMKKTFIKKNKKLAMKAFCDSDDSATERLLEKAREALEYSPNTANEDILVSLSNTYGEVYC
jgi:hypothetical protein